MDEIHNSHDWGKALQFFSYCVLAATFSRSFLQTVSGRFISKTDFRDLSHRVSETDKRAGDAQQQLETTEEIMSGIVESQMAPQTAVVIGSGVSLVSGEEEDAVDDGTELVGESGIEWDAVRFVSEGEVPAARSLVGGAESASEGGTHAAQILTTIAATGKFYNVEALHAATQIEKSEINQVLRTLAAQGLIATIGRPQAGVWRITQAGRAEALRIT